MFHVSFRAGEDGGAADLESGVRPVPLSASLSLASGALFTGHFLEVRKNCLSACVYADRQHLSDHVTDAVCTAHSPSACGLQKTPTERQSEKDEL